MRRLCVLLVPCCLAACSSGSIAALPGSTVVAGPTFANPADAPVGTYISVAGENEAVEVSVAAAPFIPSGSAPQSVGTRAAMNAPKQSRTQATVTQYDNGGQAGVMIKPGSTTGTGAVYVSMSAYDGVQLTAPQSASSANTLYAPTTHGPNGDCFELTTAYWRHQGDAGTSRYVRLFNFCNGGTWEDVYDKRIDAHFVQTYVRIFAGGDGHPEYTSEQVLEADGKWHVLIYNYSAQRWEDWGGAYAGRSNVLGDDGWSIFETHYTVGGCSALPPIAVDGLRVLTPSGWQVVDADMGAPNTANLDCFSNQTGVHYAPSTLQTYDRWLVTSVNG